MASSADGGGRILGSLRSEDGKGVVEVEDRFDVDSDDVWSAITDPVRLADWYATVAGDLRPGGEIQIYVESDDWRGTGRVAACEPPTRLLVTTRESDESGRKGQGVPPYDETIEATLRTEDGHTVLKIEVKGMPLDAVAFYGAGWQIHIEHLASYLAGRTPGDSQPQWDELVPAYQRLAAEIR
jgi:uncharacterized protein YndB with AHSA1/START domain